MGIRRQWPPQKRPSYETGETGGRVICLALPQFPDAHKYRGDLPEIGRFSSTGGAWRGSSALRGKRPQGAQSIRPGQRNPIASRFPFTRARTTQVDENRPISGRTPLENASPRTRCYLSCSSRCRRKEKPPPRRSRKGSSKQFIMATGALEKGNAVI